MRWCLVVIALLSSAAAFAQQPPPAIEQRIRLQLGDLLFTVNVLTVQVETLTEENKRLREQLKEQPPK